MSAMNQARGSWRGSLRRTDLGPGFWTLRCEDGRSYRLSGSIPDSLEGRYVVIEGHRQAAVLDIAMIGAIICVRRIRPAEDRW